MSCCLFICPEVSFQTVHKGLLGNPEDVSVAMVTGRGETSSIFELKANQSPSRLLLLLQHKETFKCSSQKFFISNQPSISHLYCLSNLVLFHVWSQFGVKSPLQIILQSQKRSVYSNLPNDWNPNFFAWLTNLSVPLISHGAPGFRHTGSALSSWLEWRYITWLCRK